MIERRQEKNKDLENHLRKEERIEKVKSIRKKVFIISFLIIILLISLLLYMRYIGTGGLVVKETSVRDKNLPTEFHGFKVVQFSDLNYLSTVHEKGVKNLVKKVNELKPDIIVFTGDLLAKGSKPTDKDIVFLTKQLQMLNANVAMYAVKGNKDYNKYYDKVMGDTKFKIINNNYDLVYYKGNTPIIINGCGSSIKKDCDLGQAFSYSETDNLYTITLVHETSNIKTINNQYKPNMILAGHNLNGQIRLPFIGGIIRQREGSEYLDSKYTLSNSKLFVSGGIGTENTSFRLFNRPSINFFRLVKEAK